MKLNISKKNDIHDMTGWFLFAPPKGGLSQWKEGRSAMELARFATSADFEKMIKKLLSDFGLNVNQNFECEPEAETYFPSDKMGTSGPRNHDLLMIGDDCVIGIEAKVSESFDKTIREKRNKASDNMNKRLDGAIKYIYGENTPQNVEDLRYQLFSATIGTIEETRKNKKGNAIILVIVFKGDVDKEKKYDDNIKLNEKDYNAFIQTLPSYAQCGKFKVSDSESAGINCYIQKVEVEIIKNTTYNFQP